jgi:thymidine kinase
MGIFIKCKRCGEAIEMVRNKNNRKIPMNIEPSVVVDKDTREYKSIRLNHFVTCNKNKNYKN